MRSKEQNKKQTNMQMLKLYIQILKFSHLFWARKTTLTPPLFIEVKVKVKVSGHVYVCWMYRLCSMSTILRLDFGIIPTVW